MPLSSKESALNDSRADALHAQHRAREPFTPFTGDRQITDIADAYAVQARLVARWCKEQGCDIVGYKIGLTSPRMQALLGIDSPIGGAILQGRLLRSGARVSRADFGRLGIECEIAVRLGTDLPAGGAPYDRDTVAGAVAAVCPAFELVDDRAADYAATDIGSLVADNSWNAGVVLGEFSDSWPDLASVTGVVSRNGVELDRGCGADVLGHPFVPLAWLANHLAAGGRGLRAGDVIATGSMVPTRVPEEAEHCVFRIDGLGEVALGIVD